MRWEAGACNYGNSVFIHSQSRDRVQDSTRCLACLGTGINKILLLMY